MAEMLERAIKSKMHEIRRCAHTYSGVHKQILLFQIFFCYYFTKLGKMVAHFLIFGMPTLCFDEHIMRLLSTHHLHVQGHLTFSTKWSVSQNIHGQFLLYACSLSMQTGGTPKNSSFCPYMGVCVPTRVSNCRALL